MPAPFRAPAVDVGGTAGLTTDLRYAILSLGGFMRYDLHIPGVENPQFAQATTSFVNRPPPTRIVYSGGFAYGGHLRLRVPVPRFGVPVVPRRLC